MHTQMNNYLRQGFKFVSVSLLLSLVILVTGCSQQASQSGTGVTVSIATPDNSSSKTSGNLLAGVSIGTAFPYLSEVTLQITGGDFTTATINKDYNGGSFTLNAQGDAIVLSDTTFSINVPLETDLTFIVVAYNLSGYRLFSATTVLSAADLSQTNPILPIAMRVDIDPAVPVLATDAGCTGDADGDGYCDIYEDMFVRDCSAVNPVIGIAPDVDCDGVINSQDTDSDGDGVNDNVDGNIPSTDGYPTFIHRNNPPTSVSLDLTTSSGNPVSGDPVVVDPDENDCHANTILTQPANGTASILAGGVIDPTNPYSCVFYIVRYDPNPGFAGTDSFTIRSTDRNGASIDGTATVTVSGINNFPPVADAQTVVTNEDVPAPITLTGSDAEGNALTYTIVTTPSNGSLSGTGSSYVYTPNANFNGSDSFTFIVNDGALDSTPATVFLTITPVNDPPVAVDDGNRTLERASLDSAGAEANAGSMWPTLNDNGRFVTFWSSATNLVSGDTNGVFDLFLHDSLTGQTSRLTVDNSGVEADTGQTDYTLLHPAAMSIDGRYVVFESTASNLGALAGGISQLYERDILAGTTTLITSCEGDGDGDSYAPVMTPDGTAIAFTSLATSPWPGCISATDTNGLSDVYVESSAYGQRRVSVDAQGLVVNNQANGASSEPTISETGDLVAFTSTASNLIATDANGAVSDIFLKNLIDESVSLISVNSAGTQASGGNSYSPSISGDGSVIAFVSEATNLVTGDNNGVADIYVHDIQTGQTERVSVDSSGNQANGASSHPVISQNGRYVLFESVATNLVAGDTNGLGDIFIHDRVRGETYLATRDLSGTLADGHSAMPAFSGNGRYLAYATDATNIVTPDTNAVSDIVVENQTDIATTEAVALTTPNVLLNDTDVDNDPLSVLSNTSPTNGVAVDNTDGTFSYTPNAGYIGIDKFDYTVSDGAGGTDIATVTMAIGRSNYVPQGVGDSATSTGGASVTIPVLANDFDLDNDPLAVATADTVSVWGGTVILNADNTISFTPGTSLTPPYSDTFTYTVTDGTVTGLPTTVTINVQ